MLTAIEWWGGVIFVLGAITYRLVMGALDKKEEGIDWYRWQMRSFFLLPALVLAGYFYPLEGTGLQYAYLGALGISLFIEGMQYLTMRGMFDTLDILLYILGISLGALLFRLLRLKIE